MTARQLAPLPDVELYRAVDSKHSVSRHGLGRWMSRLSLPWGDMNFIDVRWKIINVLKGLFKCRVFRLKLLIHGNRDESSLIPVDDMPGAWATRVNSPAWGEESVLRIEHKEFRNAKISRSGKMGECLCLLQLGFLNGERLIS